MTSYKWGDVLLVEFPQLGSDQKKKKRPALVVLDIGDADVMLAPLTTQERTSLGDLKLIDWSPSGLLRESWVRLAKIACLEKKDVVRPLGRLSERDKAKVAQVWRDLFML